MEDNCLFAKEIHFYAGLNNTLILEETIMEILCIPKAPTPNHKLLELKNTEALHISHID